MRNVEVKEIGDEEVRSTQWFEKRCYPGCFQVTVFECSEEAGKIATIIVRGASQSRIDDVERAIDDAVNYYKALTKDNRVGPVE